MDLMKLNEDVLDVVEYFDCNAKPFGLYAARDILLEANPQKVIGNFSPMIQRRPDLRYLQPFINKMTRLTEWAKQNEVQFRFEAESFGQIDLMWVRTSKIKVRKFGSSYRLDKQENFASRWQELDLGESLTRLWRPLGARFADLAPPNVRMLIFTGFDRTTLSFERELEALKAHQNRKSHDVNFVSREWEDHSERKFFVRAAVWARQNQNNV